MTPSLFDLILMLGAIIGVIAMAGVLILAYAYDRKRRENEELQKLFYSHPHIGSPFPHHNGRYF